MTIARPNSPSYPASSHFISCCDTTAKCSLHWNRGWKKENGCTWKQHLNVGIGFSSMWKILSIQNKRLTAHAEGKGSGTTTVRYSWQIITDSQKNRVFCYLRTIGLYSKLTFKFLNFITTYHFSAYLKDTNNTSNSITSFWQFHRLQRTNIIMGLK